MKRKDGEGSLNALGYWQFSRNGKLMAGHVLVAEAALGKPLPKGAQVHHVDDDRANNAPNNLVVCPDQKYHRLLHRRTAAINAGYPANYIICRHCHEYDDPDVMKTEGSRSMSHPTCRSQYRRALYAEGRRGI